MEEVSYNYVDNTTQDSDNNEEDKLWKKVETVMKKKKAHVISVLEDHGIGDADGESDGEEEEIWKMIQGDIPYTLDLV